MAAFTAAWAAGAHWVEADTQPTADRVPVLLHDEDLQRTTSGSGPVREIRALDLAVLDAGSWFGPVFRGARVPELTELLDALPPDCGVLLEIKGGHTPDQLLAVLDAVRAVGADDRILLESFEVPALRALADLVPGLPVGLLAETLHEDPVAAARELGAAAYNPRVGDLLSRPQIVEDLHDAGVAVMVWTTDDPSEWAALTDLGVDAIITNTPAELLAWQAARVG